MRVEVTLVAFRYPEPTKWGAYASYCSETHCFCAFGKNVPEVVEEFKKILFCDLQNRLAYENMKIWGWKGSENSAIPPVFANEYAIQETERVFEVTIKEPIIIKVDVELPRAEKTS